MSNIKLGVEVASARDLMPKDVEGSASACVELQFDNQNFRTTVKEKDLNPYWNETFYFNISDPNSLSELTLEANVYNNATGNNPNLNPFMGRVRINGTSFVPYSDAVVSHYPLKKRSILSNVKGELDLKVFITDNPSIRSSDPIPQMETSSYERKEGTFHHLPLPNPNFHQQQPYAYENMGSSSQPLECSIKEKDPVLGGGQVTGGGKGVNSDNRRANTYDLVKPMPFLFVRVVKAQNLPCMDVKGSLDLFVEVRLGNYKGITQHFSKTSNPEYNTVFAFSKERMQASVLDVVVKDKDIIQKGDDFVRIVCVNLHDIPIRVPPDSALVPEWYRLKDRKGDKRKGEIMLAVWSGTQADEAFPDAFLVDASMNNVDSSLIPSIYTRSKVYYSPTLWYVRVSIIEVQDLVWAETTRFPDVYVKGQINNQATRTRLAQVRAANAIWNEDLIFVAAEPFEDQLALTVEHRIGPGPGNDEVLGKVFVPLTSMEWRADDRMVKSRWFDLQDPDDNEIYDDEKKKKKGNVVTRLHLRVCLEGGYHVLDESPQYSSDLRPTAKQLWEAPIGKLDLGILNAPALKPMKTRDGKGTVDAYCVAKYGRKWIRTRTVIDNLAPRFNEQYTWDVYDPSTVLTVGVFDGGELENGKSKDDQFGKIRIRVSNLEIGRIYTHSYPLLALHPIGVKKMGDLQLAIRFSSNTSVMNMMLIYSKPLLPRMHYLRPLQANQLEMLRHHAVGIVMARLGGAEPPLRPEVVEYMTDVSSHLWSMRRSKELFSRLMLLFDEVVAHMKWFREVCLWENLFRTVFAHVLFVALVCYPDLILPSLFFSMFVYGMGNYYNRVQYPLHMNTRLSYADGVHPDEFDEEFDTFPTSKSQEFVRHRYDRLRSLAGQIQSVLEDVVSQWEQFRELLSWHDPRATVISMVVSFVAGFVLYIIPFHLVVLVGGFYVMRHPRFRHSLPSPPMNFFRRLPPRIDSML